MLYEPLIVNETDVSLIFSEKQPYFDFEDSLLQGSKTDVVTILRQASEQISLARKLYPIITTTECLSDSEPVSPVSRAPVRILMLHGTTALLCPTRVYQY